MCRGKVKPKAQSAGGTGSHRAARSCLAPAVPCCTVTQNLETLMIIYRGGVGRFNQVAQTRRVSWTQAQWPQSQGEGEVGKPDTSLASWPREFRQGPVVRDLTAPPSQAPTVQLHLNHRPRAVNLRARILRTTSIFMSPWPNFKAFRKEISPSICPGRDIFSWVIVTGWTFSQKSKCPPKCFPWIRNPMLCPLFS